MKYLGFFVIYFSLCTALECCDNFIVFIFNYKTINEENLDKIRRFKYDLMSNFIQWKLTVGIGDVSW